MKQISKDRPFRIVPGLYAHQGYTIEKQDSGVWYIAPYGAPYQWSDATATLREAVTLVNSYTERGIV